MRATPISCPWCSSRHMPRFLCDPAAAVLKGMADRAEANHLPSVDFDRPVDVGAVGDQVILSQFTASAAVLPTGGGVKFPAVVFSGRDQHGNPLPRWLYVGTTMDLQRGRDMLCKQIDLAVERSTS